MPNKAPIQWTELHRLVTQANRAFQAADFLNAVRCMDAAVEHGLRDDPDLRFSYAIALLTVGRWREGFEEMEGRFESKGYRPYLATIQQYGETWTGQDLRGRRLILWSDGGRGDAIMHSRFALDVEALGCDVAFLVNDELAELFRASFPFAEICPELRDDDLFCPLGTLLLRFGIDVDSKLWHGPYLRAPAVSTAVPDVPALKVGLVWAGNPGHPGDAERSITFDRLDPILRVPGVHFFPLTMRRGEELASHGAASGRWTDLRDGIRNFADTASLIEQLDLIITVDTAVAHLAGALGRPTWVLIPFVHDWRWGMEGTESSWYPSIRLWRQAAEADWATPIEQVANALQRMARDRLNGPTYPEYGMRQPACKVCGGPTWGVGTSAPPTRLDEVFEYFRCKHCGFLFSDSLDTWSTERIQRVIYNEDLFTPDEAAGWPRPKGNAELLDRALDGLKSKIRIVDYGGGPGGRMVEALRERGFSNAVSYDPYYGTEARPLTPAHLVTSFEVAEHVLNVHDFFSDIATMMAPGGVLFFSTTVQPEDIVDTGFTWWYIAPAVGHVSLHSRASLALCAQARGWTFESFTPELHAMYTVRHWWVERLARVARSISWVKVDEQRAA